MKKIVMIPLDDRPCNYNYPKLLPTEDYEIILPDKKIMPYHKQEGNHQELEKWLLANILESDACILSMDTLIFGGLVPSRLHHYSYVELIDRLNVIKKIKEINPNIKLLGFELIMRCPDYSSDAEEPTYYKDCGYEIHKLGELRHLKSLGKCTSSELEEIERLESFIKEDYLSDYLQRRETNLKILLETLKLVNDGYFDYFIVPQDDASVYGFTALDQIKVRNYIKDNILHTKVSMYPAADDVGITLIARAISLCNNIKPKVYVKYASPKAFTCIPWFEDRMQDETIKYHILSVNGIRVYSIEECDIVLCVNMTSKMCNKDDSDFSLVYDIERNLSEFISYIKYALSMNKVVSVCDTAYCKGSDTEFVKLLEKEDLLLQVSTYAGWNTSSNTIGTALGSSVLYFFGRNEESRIKFLIYRYYEDYAYMAYARSYVSENILPKYELDYFDLKDKNKNISEYVKEEIKKVIDKDLNKLTKYVKDINIIMPWNRMFECELEIIFNKMSSLV